MPDRLGAVEPAAEHTHDVALLGRLFDAQVASRHLDHTARWLRSGGHGHYTIGSSGHEGNAPVAAAVEHTDPALLHYRSGGFHLTRRMLAHPHGPDDGLAAGIDDVLGGMLALAEEPIAGGRHKVFGHPDLAIVPQTSTIASHLPRAMGTAFAIDRAARLGVQTRWPDDAIAVCSFGDASLNHSTAQGAINAAVATAARGVGMPLLLVCEDNGLGISVPTPPGWVASTLRRDGLRYEHADGCDVDEVLTVAADLAAWVRATRRPAVLHLSVVRLFGHAGTDVETAYRSPAAIRADEARDPLLRTAARLVGAGMRAEDVAARYVSLRHVVRERALALLDRPRLTTAAQVMAPLAPRRPDRVSAVAPTFAATTVDDPKPLTLAETIDRTLAEALASRSGMLVFGEDVGVKGGVYGVTRGLAARFGPLRVFDTILDEQSILGVALGASLSGLLPVPEIQYLAYLHNAIDQLRGEAATLSFFSQGAYRNGMVVRIAGLAYQLGFGGHFHNDDALGPLRDIPGLVVACPAHPADAAPMLRSCLAAAEVDGTVSVFLEPIARYHTRDLHEPGDGGWLAPFDATTDARIGSARIVREGADLLIVTSGNGVHLSLRAARALAGRGIECRVLDLRWLVPLPIDDVLTHANDIGRALVVDETRRSGGVSEGVITGLVDRGCRARLRRIAAHDSFVPLGAAANLVLVSEDDIVHAATEMVR
jgi:2-oxoisovalerate dehydrogenase E1 component